MEIVDRELLRRGLVKIDAHRGNIMMNPSSNELVYLDLGFFQVLQPGQKIRYGDDVIEVVSPSTPLDPDLLRRPARDPDLAPNPQVKDEDIAPGKYNPLEEVIIDVKRWKLLAGIS